MVRLDRAGRIESSRLVIGGAHLVPLRVQSVEEQLTGAEPSGDVIAHAADLVSDAISPMSDVQAGEGYRRRIAEVLTRRVLETAIQRAREELA